MALRCPQSQHSPKANSEIVTGETWRKTCLLGAPQCRTMRFGYDDHRRGCPQGRRLRFDRFPCRQPHPQRLAGHRAIGQRGDRCRRLSAKQPGSLAEAGLDKQCRPGDLGHLQSVFQRHHLLASRPSARASASWCSSPIRRTIRTRSWRSSRLCTSDGSTASSWRPRPLPQRALGYLTERAVPCVLIDRLSDNSFDQVGVENGNAMRGADRSCRVVRTPPHRLRRRAPGICHDARTHRGISRRARRQRPRIRRRLYCHRERDVDGRVRRRSCAVVAAPTHRPHW